MEVPFFLLNLDSSAGKAVAEITSFLTLDCQLRGKTKSTAKCDKTQATATEIAKVALLRCDAAEVSAFSFFFLPLRQCTDPDDKSSLHAKQKKNEKKKILL